MKKNILIITIAILMAAVLAIPAIYGQGKVKPPVPPETPEKGQRMLMMHDKMGIPGLTDEQKEKMKSLRMELDKAVLPIQTQLEVKSAELKGLLIADNPNLAAINAKLDEIGAIRLQMQKKRVTHELDVRKLLTPEQRVEFDKRVLKGFERAENWKRRGPEMGKRARMFMRGRRGGFEQHPVIEKEEKIEMKKE